MDRVAFCLEKKRKKKQESQIGFHEEAWTWPNMSWTKSLEEKSKNMSFGKTGKKKGGLGLFGNGKPMNRVGSLIQQFHHRMDQLVQLIFNIVN